MQENRQKWVDALRSGEFVQAHGQFIERLVRRQHEGVDVEVETRYCCLAVATEVAIRSGIGTVRMRPYDSDGVLTPQVLISEAEVDPDGHEIDEVLPDGSAWVWYTDGNLPPYVREWLGFDPDNGNPILAGEYAIIRNDDYNEDFETIAAAIERTP